MLSKYANAALKVGAAIVAVMSLTACSNIAGLDFTSLTASNTPSSTTDTSGQRSYSGSAKECLMRAMYFESNRSSADGMLAVGTVVMNRVESSRFHNTICEVVGAPRQFAPGVLSREMREVAPKQLASQVADRILGGARHRGVKTAKFFHTAGLRFPYNNMNYVLEAGGNEFYIKG